jgi:hypothetical protein
MNPNPDTRIVILADMGKLRAIRLSPAGTPTTPHQNPKSIEEIDLPNLERDTDRPGSFPRGAAAVETVVMSSGENHNVKREHEKRRLAKLAHEIIEILDREGPRSWCFAAPDPINTRLLSLIPPKSRKFLTANLKVDLTHAPLEEIENRFTAPSTKN